MCPELPIFIPSMPVTHCWLDLWLGYSTEARRLWTTPYNPNLTPSDYHFFGTIKKHTVGKQFAKVASVKQVVTSRLQTLHTDVLYAWIQTLLPLWNKCLNLTVARWRSDVCHVQCTHQSQNKVLSVTASSYSLKPPCIIKELARKHKYLFQENITLFYLSYSRTNKNVYKIMENITSGKVKSEFHRISLAMIHKNMA
jgi:hypothetical protein